MDTVSLISYIVDGVNDSPSKIILYGATYLEELKTKFIDYERTLKARKNTYWEKQNEKLKEPRTFRCYQCGENGHRAKVVRKERRDQSVTIAVNLATFPPYATKTRRIKSTRL